MFDKILIANRGEIACRIQKTCQKHNIKAICVAEEADKSAQHFINADEGHLIDSYLNQDAIIEVAKKTGAQAIHPGYGFLSENAEFAEAVAASGLKFIGPSPEAIRLMGSKSEAKQIAEENGVPTVPGYHGDLQDEAELMMHADAVGFPLLIKATFGGGGKGMRLVESRDGFQAALEGAQREAQKAFSKTGVILEKYLSKPRHIEVQIMADQHGNVLVFGDRDCSLQRRYQKVVEEAPAADVPDDVREKMQQCAIKLAKAVRYEGAGTVEFLLTPEGEFFFLEMNTRLQVEHPVTECFFGVDLVETQLKIASGEPLQHQVITPDTGHAIEVRLYAEDPDQGFLPTTGRLSTWKLHDRFRVDAGFVEGDRVTINYDPMLAKIIVWGADRRQAYAALQKTLRECRIEGLKTNLSFLRGLAANAQVCDGLPDVGFIDRYLQEATTRDVPDVVMTLLALWLSHQYEDDQTILNETDPNSPWLNEVSWRLNDDPRRSYELGVSDTKKTVMLRTSTVGAVSQIEDREVVVESPQASGEGVWGIVDGNTVRAEVITNRENYQVVLDGVVYHVHYRDPFAVDVSHEESEGHLMAPMPGRVTTVLVKEGEKVDKGMPLMILEAMKMEHTIKAPLAGQVEKLFFKQGDFVEDKAELISIVA